MIDPLWFQITRSGLDGGGVWWLTDHLKQSPPGSSLPPPGLSPTPPPSAQRLSSPLAAIHPDMLRHHAHALMGRGRGSHTDNHIAGMHKLLSEPLDGGAGGGASSRGGFSIMSVCLHFKCDLSKIMLVGVLISIIPDRHLSRCFYYSSF